MDNIKFRSPATHEAIGFASIAVIASLGAIGVFIAAGWWYKMKRTSSLATIVLPVDGYPSQRVERWVWTFGRRNVTTAGSQSTVSIEITPPSRSHTAPERHSAGGTVSHLPSTASFHDYYPVNVPDSVITRGEVSRQRRARVHAPLYNHVTQGVSTEFDQLTIRSWQDQNARDSVSTLPRYSTPTPDTPPPMYQLEEFDGEKADTEPEGEIETLRLSI